MRYFVSVLAIILVSCSSETKENTAMFLNQPTAKVYSITPSFKGVLTKEGKPLGNQKLIRKLKWNDNEEGIEQVFYTKENGEFELPPHEEELALGVLVEFVAKTDIYLEYPDSSSELYIWFSSKMDETLNSEFKELPQNVVCDIERAEQRISLRHGLCFTRCVWDNMPQEKSYNEP